MFGYESLRRYPTLVAVLFVGGVVGTSYAATTDRLYSLGDDSAEDATQGITLGTGGTNPVPGFTLDTEGPVGAFVDLDVFGTPTYVNVSDRPGAGVNDLGAQFDGSTDYLLTTKNLNAPSVSWDNTTADFWPGPPDTAFIGHQGNYQGLFGRGYEFWAKPTVTGAQQDLIVDTAQHAVVITPEDNWRLVYAGAGIEVDNEVSVASTLDSNGWAHVMQISGINEPVDSDTNTGGALLVNGVAIAASAAGYNTGDATALTIGAIQAGDANFYNGVLDDIRFFVWGDNSDNLGQDDAAGGDGVNRDGQDWGVLDLNVDNGWIVQEISNLETMGGITIAEGDVNLDGVVNNSDISVFASNWMSGKTINGQRVGDWTTRQMGDVNYDGIVDLFDWQILRRDHVNGGNLTLANALAGAYSVPEPASFATTLIVCGLVLCSVRRRI